MKYLPAVAVIPTFNEGDRVLAVADAALGSDNVGDVIIVDDGSTDSTTATLSKIDNVTVLTHPRNRGKGEALDTGVQYAKMLGYATIVFLDADLQNLKPEHVDQLLEPIEEQDSIMTIGYLGLRKAIIKKAVLQQWGGLSGQRAIRTEIWDYLSPRDKHRFRIEASQNARLRQNHLHHSISRVALEGVGHIGKHEKEGSWLRALWAYSKAYSSAAITYARIELERTHDHPESIRYKIID